MEIKKRLTTSNLKEGKYLYYALIILNLKIGNVDSSILIFLEVKHYLSFNLYSLTICKIKINNQIIFLI